MNWKLNKLDKTEKYLLTGLIITFIGDIASTVFFFFMGLGNQEANLFVVKYGWVLGGVLVFVFNLLLFYYFVWQLQRTIQKNRVDKRFAIVGVISLFIVFRALIVLNNFYFGITQPPQEAPNSIDLKSFWITVIIGLYIVYYIILFTYDAFTLTMNVEYNPAAYRYRKKLKERIALRWQATKNFFGIGVKQ